MIFFGDAFPLLIHEEDAAKDLQGRKKEPEDIINANDQHGSVGLLFGNKG